MPHFKSEFSEAQYQAFIESCFIEDFRINNHVDIHYYSGTAERVRGYDIEVMTFIPIFLQMKRSNCYLHGSTNAEMITRRDQFFYTDNPAGYYFCLHVDVPTIDYLQHNLLVSLCHDNKYARYVAPLFIQFGMLMNLKYNIPSIHWGNIFHSTLRDALNFYPWRDYLNFPHSILIKPHANQTKTNGIHHKYFYNRAKQISFHSEPEKIDNADYFHEFISQITEDIKSKNLECLIPLEKVFANILTAIKTTFNGNKKILETEILFIEENISFEKIESLSDMKFSENNFSVLTRYIDNRFGIKTILAGAKNYQRLFNGFL